jgi:hypothetical protein
LVWPDENAHSQRGLSTAELKEVAAHIDRERLPDRARMVDEVLHSRHADDDAGASSDPYGEQLASLSRWRLAIFLAWGGLLPAEMLIGNPLGVYFRSSAPFAIIGAAGVALFVSAGLRVSFFRCPRCGKRFTFKRYRGFIGYQNPFTSTCLHCGLTRVS